MFLQSINEEIVKSDNGLTLSKRKTRGLSMTSANKSTS